MNFKYTLLTAAVVAAASLGLAHAQNSGAAKSGDKTGGEMSTPNQDKGSMVKQKGPGKSRADVKAEAAAARASGEMAQGEQSTPKQGKKPMTAMPSEKSRAQVKSEAATANMAGDKPTGQESVKGQSKGTTKP